MQEQLDEEADIMKQLLQKNALKAVKELATVSLKNRKKKQETQAKRVTACIKGRVLNHNGES